jgi:hypothetical protein
VANQRIGRAELERRRGIVRRWLRSDESAAEFGGRLGISQWALYSWTKQTGGSRPRGGPRKRRAVLAARTPGERQDFVPVRLVADEQMRSSSPEAGFVEIQLRSGDVVRVLGEVSAERVGAVLAAVRQAC